MIANMCGKGDSTVGKTGNLHHLGFSFFEGGAVGYSIRLCSDSYPVRDVHSRGNTEICHQPTALVWPLLMSYIDKKKTRLDLNELIY